MEINLKMVGHFIDKPVTKTINIDEKADAVRLDDGKVLKVEQLKGDALDQYIYEKFIKGTPLEGRILEISIEKD